MVALPIEFDATDQGAGGQGAGGQGAGGQDLAGQDERPAGADADQANQQELARLRAELDEYQRLIEELPEIYAAKFRQRVEQVALEIRRLMEERDALQEQIQRALVGADPPSVLPAAPGPSVSRPTALAVAVGSLLRRPVALVAASLAVACGVALIGVVALRLLRPSPAPRQPTPAVTPLPRPPARPAAPELRLRARGECWLEVRGLDGALLLITTLRKGQTASVPLRAGVRLRAGRPDLLELAAADQPFRTFGAVGDLGWQTVMADDTPNQARRNVPPAASGKP